ncbi:MAG: CdaR family protein [Bacteroidia bacterium]
MRGNLSAFFICLIISGFLWLTHSLNNQYSYALSVPVKFTNLPNNKILLGSLPETIRFDVKASGLKLFFILLNKPFKELSIDFNSLKSDNKAQAYSISSGNVDLASSIRFSVEIKKISPDTLFFSNKKGLSKNVPVRPLLYLLADKGFVISRPVINPSFITISGDSATLQSIDSISTAPLYLNQITKNYNGRLLLVKPSQDVYLNLSEVNVSFTADKLLEKELEVPLNIVNQPEGGHVKLFPGRVKVRFSAAYNDFSDITEKSFRAVVNFKKQEKGYNKLPVELSVVPTQAHILAISPPEAEFLIYKSK